MFLNIYSYFYAQKEMLSLQLKYKIKIMLRNGAKSDQFTANGFDSMSLLSLDIIYMCVISLKKVRVVFTEFSL